MRREFQASFLPPELSDPDPSEKAGNWVAILVKAAEEHGYIFVPGQVGKACKIWIDKFGLEVVLPTWEVWLENGPLLGEQTSYMNPSSFAKKFGYWRQMANPAR